MNTPHFLRYARTLALGAGLASLSACGTSVTPGVDGSTSDTAAPTDTTVVMGDAQLTCENCQCSGHGPPPDASMPICEANGLGACCAAVGPLSPPELGV